MKTLRLTKSESAAYAAGARRFWRAMKPVKGCCVILIEHIDCPYGTPGDRLTLAHGLSRATLLITAITVTQRDGKWGWEIEVGA